MIAWLQELVQEGGVWMPTLSVLLRLHFDIHQIAHVNFSEVPSVIIIFMLSSQGFIIVRIVFLVEVRINFLSDCPK